MSEVRITTPTMELRFVPTSYASKNAVLMARRSNCFSGVWLQQKHITRFYSSDGGILRCEEEWRTIEILKENENVKPNTNVNDDLRGKQPL